MKTVRWTAAVLGVAAACSAHAQGTAARTSGSAHGSLSVTLTVLPRCVERAALQVGAFNVESATAPRCAPHSARVRALHAQRAVSVLAGAPTAVTVAPAAEGPRFDVLF